MLFVMFDSSLARFDRLLIFKILQLASPRLGRKDSEAWSLLGRGVENSVLM